MVGANSAQDFCTEQAPEPCGTCWVSGAGLMGGIWAATVRVRSSRLGTAATNLVILRKASAPWYEFTPREYKAGVQPESIFPQMGMTGAIRTARIADVMRSGGCG
jgi:hypothetical protein